MYYVAKVKVKIEADNGKIKKQTYQHLVNAVSVTDVEAIVTDDYKDSVNEWELVSVTESKIMSVLGA